MRNLLLCLGFILSMTVLNCEVRGADTLVFTTPAAPPLSQENQRGFIDQVVGEALARMGYQLKVTHLPAERALINANNGVDDGDLNRIAGLSKVYPNLIQIPERTFDMEFAAFTKKGDITTTRWDDLKPYTVGIITGWKILERNIPAGTSTTKVKNPEQLFTLLENNRADIILYGKWQGLQYIQEHHLTEVKLLKPSLARMDMFVYFHKKHQALTDKFSNTLREMKVDGSYQKIYDQILTPLNQ